MRAGPADRYYEQGSEYPLTLTDKEFFRLGFSHDDLRCADCDDPVGACVVSYDYQPDFAVWRDMVLLDEETPLCVDCFDYRTVEVE